MKTIFAAICLMLALTGYSQKTKYVEAMEKNLAKFDSMKTAADFQALSATFERIGDAEKTEWLPYYYSGLALTSAGWVDLKIDKDANAAKVKAVLDKADPLAKDNVDKSELLVVRNMAATQQMLVDPANRWMTFGQEGAEYMKKGKELNPSNPRLQYLEGAGIFGTPEQFGGGKSKAKPLLEKAVEMFKAEKAKPLYPTWGLQQAEMLLAQCQ